MTRTLAALSLLTVVAQSQAATTSEPFATVVRHGDTIIATLPASGVRYVVGDSQQPRVTSYSESFEFHAGASLLLTEKHSSYRVTCRFAPIAGLQVESTFDARSFGGTTSKKNYFIRAQ